MNNKRDATCLNVKDFQAAFESWENNKNIAVSELKTIASKLYNLGISPDQTIKVMMELYRELSKGNDEYEQ